MKNEPLSADQSVADPRFEGIAPSAPSKLAVYGGSFNPVHNGHISVAQTVVQKGYAEEVLFVPAGIPPHKRGKEMADAGDRLGMLAAAIGPYDVFSLSDIEIRRSPEPSYTIDTLETLTRAFPGVDLYFLMGMDSLADLHNWYRAPILANRYRFLVYPRPGVQPPSFAGLASRFGGRTARKLLNSIIEADLIPVSAKDIRSRLARGKPVCELVPEPVLRYIREHQVYHQARDNGQSGNRPEKEGNGFG